MFTLARLCNQVVQRYFNPVIYHSVYLYCSRCPVDWNTDEGRRIIGGWKEWLGWKIRSTSCAVDSNLVHVYPDEEPFDELKDDRIEIKEMKYPYDMAASGVSRSIFISDYSDNGCLWRIQMPSKEISRWEIDGGPLGLSINSSDEWIVFVHRDGRDYIDVYRCEDGGRIKKVDGGDVVWFVLFVVVCCSVVERELHHPFIGSEMMMECI